MSLEDMNKAAHLSHLRIWATGPIYMNYEEFTPSGLSDPFCGHDFLAFQFTLAMEIGIGLCGSGGCLFTPIQP